MSSAVEESVRYQVTQVRASGHYMDLNSCSLTSHES